MERLPTQLTDKQRAQLKQKVADLEADHARLLAKVYKRKNIAMHMRMQRIAKELEDLRELLIIDSRKRHSFRHAITTDAQKEDAWEY